MFISGGSGEESASNLIQVVGQIHGLQGSLQNSGPPFPCRLSRLLSDVHSPSHVAPSSHGDSPSCQNPFLCQISRTSFLTSTARVKDHM